MNRISVFALILSVIAVGGNAGAQQYLGRSSESRYEIVRQGMRKVVSENPQTTRGFNIGVSNSGLPIEGVQIGDGPIKTLVVATHHGNEYGSTYVASQFLASMAARPIPGRTVYVIPVLNISGYNANQRHEPLTAELGSVDSNRDYPGPCGPESGEPFKLRSTNLLAKFIDEQEVVASMTLHTYFPSVTYPWGVGRNGTDPYLDLFRQLASFAVEWSGYKIGNSSEVLYPANGCFEDYAFWKHGIWSLLVELGRSHRPSDKELAEMAKVNIPGIAQFLEKAPVVRAVNHEFDGKCFRGISSRRE